MRYHSDFHGGAYTGAGGIILDASAYFNDETVIDLGFIDLDGSSPAENNFVELHDNLELNVQYVDQVDNRFNGTLEFTDPATLTVNTPTPWSMAGELNVYAQSSAIVTIGGSEIILEADVYIDTDNELRFEADVSGPGNFLDGGDVRFLGVYSPGTSPATITAEGEVHFGDGARLIMEIGGTVLNQDYDRIVMDMDSLYGGGTLEVVLINGFEPQLGNTFDLFDGWISSTFAQHSLAALPIGLAWNIDNLYATGEIRVVPDASYNGDIDGDGDVDEVDLNLFLSQYSEPLNDFDRMNLNILLANFGRTDLAPANIPEPSAFTLFIIATLCLLVPWRRKIR
jgi:hypothetical protein